MVATKSSKSRSKICRFVGALIRALVRVRDAYVKSMNSCSDHVTYGGAYGCSSIDVTTLPREFSGNRTSTSQEDFRELVKVSSTTLLADYKIITDELEYFPRRPRQQSTGTSKVMPTCKSLTM